MAHPQLDPVALAFEKFIRPDRAPVTPRDQALLDRGRNLGLVGGMTATAWGEGPTVMLAHGWNSRGTHWGAHVEALTGAGQRVVAVDAPGHGASPGESCHVLEYGQKLVEAGRALGPLAGIVGHSFGAGAVVLGLGRGLRADRVVLLSGPATLTGVVERWARAHGLLETTLPAFCARVEHFVGAPIIELDLLRIVGGLDQLALIVHDQGDDEVPVAESQILAGAWPGAQLMLTERYGHRRILIAREVVRAVVEFLTDQPPGPER